MIIYGSKSSLGIAIDQDGFSVMLSFKRASENPDNAQSAMRLSYADIEEIIAQYKNNNEISLVRSYNNANDRKSFNIKRNPDGSYFCSYFHNVKTNKNADYNFSLKIEATWMSAFIKALLICEDITLRNDMSRFIKSNKKENPKYEENIPN